MNEVVGLGALKFFSFVILSEVTVECVIGFSRIVRILEDHWKGKLGTIIFNAQQTWLCVGLKNFFQGNRIAGFVGLNLFPCLC
jgi:hypothetical protein